MTNPCLSKSVDNKDSLVAVIAEGNEQDTSFIEALVQLSQLYWYSNSDTAFIIAERAYKLAENMNDLKSMADAENSMAATNLLRGDYSNAIRYWRSSLNHLELINDRHGVARTLGNLGIPYKELGDYPKALKYYYQALSIDQALGNRGESAKHLCNIGILNDLQGNYEEALNYYSQSVKILGEIGDTLNMEANLGNMGVTYRKMGNYSKALEFYFQAYKYAKKLDYKRHIATWQGNIAIIYEKQMEATTDKVEKERLLDLALEYHNQALITNKKIGNTKGAIVNMTNLGDISKRMGNFENALDILSKALKQSEEIKSLYMIKILNESLSSVYVQAENYQAAYNHYKEYSLAKDSLFNENKSKEIGKLEAKYEFEMAEQERIQIEKQRRTALAEAQRRRDNLQYSGILIFLVLVFAGVFMLGKFSIPLRLAEGMIFFAFLLLFEFMLVMLDPYIDRYSGGEPAYKLLFNAVLAGMIFPLHSFFEEMLKKRIMKRTKEQTSVSK
ncbi:MAG: tetratricopeptide repeat protein [Bacteroidota bacterium]